MVKKGKAKGLTLDMDYGKIGQWAFLIGILVAVAAGFVAIPYLAVILIVAGLAVGILNIRAGEVHEFLTASMVLLLVGAAGLGAIELFGAIIESILKNLVVFVAPAALVVALNSIWSLAKSS